MRQTHFFIIAFPLLHKIQLIFLFCKNYDLLCCIVNIVFTKN